MINENYRSGNHEAQQTASGLAVEALSFIASDGLLFSRFLRLTGLELENLRQAADEPAFLAGVLDFVLSDERILTDFAAHIEVPPERVAAARRVMAGPYAESYS
ncbi:DUF3572 domain-containing protein [Aureimonas sp. AU40]|uniref:DUF3572 domain-containing protein n=1 Tax=Aureimonas sp. AU40 TaxID=1637747 RepID=UPI000781D9F8|nr:DUF3572 domain-containing protein [Aureimonas sp. AU40]